MKQKNTNYDYGIPTSLLRFLGACVYGDPEAYYIGLNEGERAELDVQGRTFGMTAWFYRYLCNVLPEEKKLAYREQLQAEHDDYEQYLDSLKRALDEMLREGGVKLVWQMN